MTEHWYAITKRSVDLYDTRCFIPKGGVNGSKRFKVPLKYVNWILNTDENAWHLPIGDTYIPSWVVFEEWCSGYIIWKKKHCSGELITWNGLMYMTLRLVWVWFFVWHIEDLFTFKSLLRVSWIYILPIVWLGCWSWCKWLPWLLLLPACCPHLLLWNEKHQFKDHYYTCNEHKLH